jgi:hypothetical protein
MYVHAKAISRSVLLSVPYNSTIYWKCNKWQRNTTKDPENDFRFVNFNRKILAFLAKYVTGAGCRGKKYAQNMKTGSVQDNSISRIN